MLRPATLALLLLAASVLAAAAAAPLTIEVVEREVRGDGGDFFRQGEH
jgi:hypothetical protein